MAENSKLSVPKCWKNIYCFQKKTYSWKCSLGRVKSSFRNLMKNFRQEAESFTVSVRKRYKKSIEKNSLKSYYGILGSLYITLPKSFRENAKKYVAQCSKVIKNYLFCIVFPERVSMDS